MLKSVLCMNLYLEEHIWEIAKSSEFLKLNVASYIIVGIGVYRVWVHTCTISYSIESLLNMADIDGGVDVTIYCLFYFIYLFTHLLWYPSISTEHLHSFTNFLSLTDLFHFLSQVMLS